MKTGKNVLILDGNEIIKSIKAKYGDNPVFSSKYESVKKSVLNKKITF